MRQIATAFLSATTKAHIAKLSSAMATYSILSLYLNALSGISFSSGSALPRALTACVAAAISVMCLRCEV
jgi:hypothetical protein